MKNLKEITAQIFSENLLNNTRANRIILSYYSFRAQREVTLSICRKSKNALSAAIEYLNSNKDLKEILINAFFVQRNAWGSVSEHHEYSTTLTLQELNSAING